MAGRAEEFGLGTPGHPLLGAAVELPATGGIVLTGRLSLTAQPWLADHVVAGQVLVPGTALVEMAVRAADEAGRGRVEEFLIEQPMALRARGGVQVQVTVAEPGEAGRREVAIYSRSADAAADGPWTRHAAGWLAQAREDAGAGAGIGQWPPAGAVPVDISALYPALRENGLGYGPVFQGVRAAWRRGEEVFTEVSLPEDTQVAGFGLHPALLDAAMHVIASDAAAGGDRHGPLVPFAWGDVVVHASGASAARVRIRPAAAAQGMSVTLADAADRLIASVGSLVVRPLPAAAQSEGTDALFRLDWVPAHHDETLASSRWAVLGEAGDLNVPGAASYRDLAELAAAVDVPDVVVTCCLPGDGDDRAAAARDAVVDVLALLQDWLAAGPLEASRLVIVTRYAVDAGPGAPVELAAAPVWGLVRAAAAENPGRLVLADVDDMTAAGELVVRGVALGEPEFAARGGQLRVPRLARAEVVLAIPAPAREGTMLVTGASGGLGQLVARHLAATGRARRLVLVSRRGLHAPGMAALAGELSALGAEVRVTACDTADRAGLAQVIAASGPLTGVVHAAGVLDDGITGSLTPARIEAVMRPKADAAWYLHELTKDMDLDTFVLFSSLAGTWGSAGQGNYAAANAFLDGLAATRRRQGLTATALAWGPWQQSGGMTGQLTDASWRRLARAGFKPLADDEGLTLLDAAAAAGDALLVPVRLDMASLRSLGDELSPLLSGLVRPVRRAAGQVPANGGGRSGLAARLEGLQATEQTAVIRQVVLAKTAQVLGMTGMDAHDAGRSFRDLGFDSLTAVELRNQLNAVTGLRLPATLVFDYPTPEELTGFVRLGLLGETTDDSGRRGAGGGGG